MLVEVLTGQDEASATPTGSFYFARSPDVGEEIEMEGKRIVVKRAWHRPDVHYAGPKFAILVDPWDNCETAAHDDAGSVI